MGIRSNGQIVNRLVRLKWPLVLDGGHSVLALSEQELDVVLPADPLVRTHALLAVALRQLREVVVLGPEHSSLSVVERDDHVRPHHLGTALGPTDAEAHVLVLLDPSVQLYVDVVPLNLPPHLQPAAQQFSAVGAFRLGRRCLWVDVM